MSDFWHAAAEWVGRTAVGGGLVLGLGWAWLRVVEQPARRQRLAAWTVRAAVLTAVLSLLPGWLTVPVPEWAKPAPADPRSVEHATATEPVSGTASFTPLDHAFVAAVPRPRVVNDDPFPGPAVVPPVDEAIDQPGGAPAPAPAPVPAPALVPASVEVASPTRVDPDSDDAPPAPPGSSDQLAAIAPLVLIPYGLIAAAGLLRLAAGQAALARLRRTGRPAPPELQAAFADLAFGIPFSPRLLVSDTVPSPVCFGVFRPTVLLPRPLVASATPEQIRWVLAHELDHLRRGDAWTGLWVAAARAVFFFLPWFWAVRRELSLAQEYLADAAAAAAGGRPVDYAAFLVDLSARPGESKPGRHPPGAVGVRAGKSDLFRRVTMLLKANSRLEKAAPRGWSLLAAGGVVSAAVVLSGIGLAADDEAKARKVVVVEQAKDEARADGDKKDEPKKAERRVVEVRVQGGASKDIAAAKKAVEEAARKGDLDAVREAVEKLEKALASQPKSFIVDGHQLMAPGAHVAPLAPAAPMVWRTNTFRPAEGGDQAVKEMEKAVAGLKKAAEAVKDQPEAKAALEKSIAEYQKKIEEAKKAQPKAAVTPTAPVPPMAPLQPGQWQFHPLGAGDQKQLAEQLRKSVEKQLEGLKDNPEAQAALKKAMEESQKALAESQKALEQAFKLQNARVWEFQQPGGAHFNVNPVVTVRAVAGQGRLGIVPEGVPAVLADQLDLPKGQGVLIAQVVKGSAAEKAGFKTNDILVKLGGKDVPGEPVAVAKLIAELKAGDLEAVVVRKGKRETVKLTLPEAPKPAQALERLAKVKEAKEGRKPNAGEESDSAKGKKIHFSSMAVSVNNDEFTIKAEGDGVRYVIEGTVADGKPVPSSISVRSGSEKKQEYGSLDKVPAAHQAAVKQLLSGVGGGK